LANKWSRKSFPQTEEEFKLCKSESMNRELDRIELMILLDLIGSPNPRFYSYFPNTKPLFNRLIDIGISFEFKNFSLIEIIFELLFNRKSFITFFLNRE
jgi:hypothetical protein